MTERAVFLAGIALVVGFFGSWRAFKELARAIRFRFERGRPYVPGSISRTAFSSLVFLSIFAAGAGLGTCRWLLRPFQQIHGVTHAGRVRVTESDSGGLLLELQVDARQPQAPVMAAGLPGRTWWVSGTVISFPAWLRVAGLDAAHRVQLAGWPGQAPPAVPTKVARATRWLRYLPAGVQIHRRSLVGTGPLPVWMSVNVSRDGYTLGGRAGADGGI
ncbi:MAG: hypothetical protein ACE5HD_06910 [Acidobacteriota bacterium]